MASIYATYGELARQEREGEDFQVRVIVCRSGILVVAPHGGKIEMGTTELAEAIAHPDHSFYSLEGLKASGKERLHLPSHQFDEPRAMQAVAQARLVVAVHGQDDDGDAYVMVGGLHTGLCSRVQFYLSRSGFRLRKPPQGLRGIHPANICNRGVAGRGVQLELSLGLRRLLRREPVQFDTFVAAVRTALDGHTTVTVSGDEHLS